MLKCRFIERGSIENAQVKLMSVMPSLFLSDNVLDAVFKIIENRDSSRLDKESLVYCCDEAISLDNAQKNINSLKKLGILDDQGLLTDLGKRWANSSERARATEDIIHCVYPDGISRFFSDPFSKDFVPWLMGYGEVTKSVAKKNAGVFRLLMKRAGMRVEKETEFSSADQESCEDSGYIVFELKVPLSATAKDISEIINLSSAKGWEIRALQE